MGGKKRFMWALGCCFRSIVYSVHMIRGKLKFLEICLVKLDYSIDGHRMTIGFLAFFLSVCLSEVAFSPFLLSLYFFAFRYSRKDFVLVHLSHLLEEVALEKIRNLDNHKGDLILIFKN